MVRMERWQTRFFLTLSLYLLFVTLAAFLVFRYPADLILPYPLAGLFGPLLAIRLGYDSDGTTFFSEGVISLVLVSICVLPVGVWQNWLTTGLFAVGVLLWLITGLLAGQMLYA